MGSIPQGRPTAVPRPLNKTVPNPEMAVRRLVHVNGWKERRSTLPNREPPSRSMSLLKVYLNDVPRITRTPEDSPFGRIDRADDPHVSGRNVSRKLVARCEVAHRSEFLAWS